MHAPNKDTATKTDIAWINNILILLFFEGGGQYLFKQEQERSPGYISPTPIQLSRLNGYTAETEVSQINTVWIA